MKTQSDSVLDDAPVAGPQRDYEQWFDGKVRAALADTRPPVPHAQLIDSLRERLAHNCDPRKS